MCSAFCPHPAASMPHCSRLDRSQGDAADSASPSPLFPGPLPLGLDSPSALGQREDLQALGLVILELVFAALAEGRAATGPALQRLLMDVFASDTQAFR